MKTLNLGWSSFFCRKITVEILRLLYGLLMEIIGLVDGVIDFAMEAWSGRAQLQ